MIACDRAMSPPTPRPMAARKPTSWAMFWANPEASEESRKIAIAPWNITLRPYRSESLPQIGVEAVEVSSVADTTQASWS